MRSYAALRTGGIRSRGRAGIGFSSTNRSWWWKRFEKWPVRSSLLDQLNVQMDVHFVAEHHSAGLERRVECQAEVAALDDSGGFSASTKIAPRILGLDAGTIDIQRGFF